MKSNFNKFQEKLFKHHRRDGSIVAATADKGLGPVAVALTQYTKDSLLHLQDEHIYVTISKEQALQDNIALRLAIRGWMRKHVRVLPKTQDTTSRQSYKKAAKIPLETSTFFTSFVRTLSKQGQSDQIVPPHLMP